MGYSLDSSSNAMVVKGASIDTDVHASAGTHVLHVKSWGKQGSSCVKTITITIVAQPGGGGTGSITVATPTAGAEVSSPFTLSASAGTCSSRQVVSMGYSLDSSSDTTAFNGNGIDTQVTAAAGAHVLHVKSWGGGGTHCVVDTDITVGSGGGGGTTGSPIPADAIKVSSVQSLSNWKDQHDTATGSSSSGSMSVVNSPSLSGFARKFTTQFSNSGGQRYSDNFGDDTAPTNFFYDGWVYVQSPSSTIANIEMDMNQVTSNGDTVIYGFQCDGYSGTWDYSGNVGSTSSPSVKWFHASGTSCNPRNWTTNTWHHVQVWYSRDGSGNVTYHSVTFDGAVQPINATVNSNFGLGWAPVLVTNFQVDGLGSSGESVVYLDNLTVYRW